ncbi:hypothetical protein CHH57_01565 [Niallia circulans]|uniref:Uncharacterized protein n=1 Tax=Niallia circulans TaxID=1397 RepID=A0AA91Z2Y7_NIACI|nr:hypothetical protein [Niallia circulans]PAD85025.1 hypothetical protein CHH57_01565 [Niallia circulans]
MGKSTDLKLTKKKVKEVHETEKYELNDGSTITFYPLFPHTKILELHEDLQNILATKDENINLSEKLTFSLLHFFIIKHFTHFKSQLKAKTFNEVLGEIDALIDLRVDNGDSAFEFIMNELFLQTEINKVYQYTAKHIAQFEYVEKLQNMVQEHLFKLDLKNADLIESAFKQKKQIPMV